MVGTFIIMAWVALGITSAALASKVTDAQVATCISAASKAAARAVSERQVRFQARALAHGMPTTHAAHECTRANGRMVVAAQALDGSGHAVFIDGKAHTLRMHDGKLVVKAGNGHDYASKVAAGAAYCLARDCDYVIHNAQCTPAHVKAAQVKLAARVGGVTGKVRNTTRKRSK